MGQRVVLVSDGHRVEGCGADVVNRFLAHLGSRAFSRPRSGLTPTIC